LRIGEPPIDAPYDLSAVQTLLKIEQAFPQAPGPAQGWLTGQDVTGPKVATAVDALRDPDLGRRPGPRAGNGHPDRRRSGYWS